MENLHEFRGDLDVLLSSYVFGRVGCRVGWNVDEKKAPKHSCSLKYGRRQGLKLLPLGACPRDSTSLVRNNMSTKLLSSFFILCQRTSQFFIPTRYSSPRSPSPSAWESNSGFNSWKMNTIGFSADRPKTSSKEGFHALCDPGYNDPPNVLSYRVTKVLPSVQRTTLIQGLPPTTEVSQQRSGRGSTSSFYPTTRGRTGWLPCI